MKELDNVVASLDLQHKEARVNEERNIEKIGSFKKRIKDGHIFFYDIDTKELGVVEEKEYEVFDIARNNKKRATLTGNRVYVEALNARNAMRKFLKGQFSFITKM